MRQGEDREDSMRDKISSIGNKISSTLVSLILTK